MQTRPELNAHPRWLGTGNSYFPVVASVDGHWWVLRLNNFPDHPMWTLFVDGARRFDLDDEPECWGNLPIGTTSEVDAPTVREALGPISTFLAYGSEVGQPCDGLFCCFGEPKSCFEIDGGDGSPRPRRP